MEGRIKMKDYNIFLSGAITCFGKTSFNYGNEWREELKNRLENMDSKYKVSVTNPNDYYNFISVEYDSDNTHMLEKEYHLKLPCQLSRR